MEIDVYFIAGQSNASGYSLFREEDVTDPALFAGYDYVLYAGNSRCADAERRAVNRVLPLCKTKIGYGYDQRHFGPEAGMAQAFSAEYNEKSGKKACIVKYAAGGTSLLDSLEGSNACEGNWTPPSYALAFGAKDGRTGGLYRRFMAQAARRTRNSSGRAIRRAPAGFTGCRARTTALNRRNTRGRFPFSPQISAATLARFSARI